MPARMGGDVGGGQALFVQHPAHGVEAIQRADVEGGAPEAAAVGAVLDPAGRAFQMAELGEPAGDDRTRTEAGRGMQEAGAFARHGVFVAARQIEDLVRHRRQVGRHGHEPVIAVDHYPGARGVGQGRQLGHGVEHLACAEEDLADQDQVMAARLGRRHEALGEGGEGMQRHPRDHGFAGLFPAFRLAAERVKLAVGGQDAHRLCLHARDDAQQDVVGVGRKDQTVGRGQVQLLGHVRLRLGNDLAEDQVPLAVGEAVGLGPGLHLRVETGVWPQVMAVGGEMQPLGIETQGAREEGFVAHGAKLAGGGGGVTCRSSVIPGRVAEPGPRRE